MLRAAICITTHNRLPELMRTIRHIAALQPQAEELWIVADGCTDGTAEWVRKEVPNARLIEHTPGRGSIPSRNAMAQATSCEVFLSLDDDSYPLEEDAIARIIELFEKQPRLAVAEFPQRTDERPDSLHPEKDFGKAQFIGSYANSAAAVRRKAFEEVGGYEAMFFHAYEEPDFALRCCAAGWQVRYEPTLHIRHHFTTLQRDECRTHHRHARNELWSVFLRCPLPWAVPVALFRIARQAGYARRRGWLSREPQWWREALCGLRRCWQSRRPVAWQHYRAWMQLLRHPHEDAARWAADFGGRAG